MNTNESTSTEKPADVEASEFMRLLSRVEALEAEVSHLKQAMAFNAPAIQAAWMHVPIGANSALPFQAESLGEPFSSILHENLNDLYER